MKVNNMEKQCTNLDIIKEVSNIASGNAISSLADFTNKHIDIYVPSVDEVELQDIPKILGREEDEIVVAIYQEIFTGFHGSILFVVSQESLRKIIYEILNEYDDYKYTNLDDIDILNLKVMDVSLIEEIGNILTGSYLNAISSLIKKEVNPSPPNLLIDMAATVLFEALVERDSLTDDVFFIKTELYLDNNKMNGQVFLIPRKNGYDELISNIKEVYNIE